MSASCNSTMEFPDILRSLPGLNIFLLPDAPKFTILEVNDAYIMASQTKREDLLGKGIFEAFPDNPDDDLSKIEANLKASLLKVLTEKVPHEMPVQKYDIRENETGNIEERYWFPKNTPMLDDSGNVAYIMHSVADVTATILLEQKVKKSKILLEKSQQHYYSLFHQNPDAVFSFDLEGNFLSANETLADLAECSLAEIYQMSFIPFVAPEDLDKTMYHFGEASKGHPQRYDVAMLTARGNRRILNVTNLPIVVDNKVVGIYGIAKDITDHVATQNELLKNIKRFQSISKVSNDAIWEWNLITNEITRSGNEFYHQFRDNQSESPITDLWINLIHPEDVERVLEIFKKAIAAPETQLIEAIYRVQKTDGSYAYVLDRAFIDRDENGRATYIYGAAKDITARKKIEAEKETLIKELTQSNLDLKQFSYITSHNLRTPISNLIGLGKLIDETKIEDPMTRMLLEKYKQTTLKLNENVNDLLEILIIKNNQEIPVKEVHIDDVFQQVADSVDTYITQSGAQINTDFSAGNSVNFNPGYLHSILLNLLTNAIKYRSPDRDLHIMVQTENRDGHLFLHFSDNGLGMDLQKYGDRIFGLYQKFHDHPESKGLGLHIVASQIKAMGGKITLKSELNIGTTFTIQFN